MSAATETCTCLKREFDVHRQNCPVVEQQARELNYKAGMLIAELARDGAPLVSWRTGCSNYNDAFLPFLIGQVPNLEPDGRAIVEAYAQRWGVEVWNRHGDDTALYAGTEIDGLHVYVWALVEDGGVRDAD